MLLALNLYGESEFLGVFTTDRYPVDGCKIVKADPTLHNLVLTGHYSDYVDTKKKGFLTEISSHHELRESLMIDAVKNGYNAIVGYREYAHIGYADFGGNIQNDKIGIGSYSVGVLANYVLVKCK